MLYFLPAPTWIFGSILYLTLLSSWDPRSHQFLAELVCSIVFAWGRPRHCLRQWNGWKTQHWNWTVQKSWTNTVLLFNSRNFSCKTHTANNSIKHEQFTKSGINQRVRPPIKTQLLSNYNYSNQSKFSFHLITKQSLSNIFRKPGCYFRPICMMPWKS